VKVEINGFSHVRTTFPNGSVVDTKDPNSAFNPRAMKPLFVIDLIRSQNEEDFTYSTVPKNFSNTIMIIFDRAIEDL